MKIGDEVYIHGYIDEIRNDTVIIKNDGGYFGTVEPEVVLNQPEQRWIPFKTRSLTEEEKEEHPEWDCILDCILPDNGQAILVSIDLKGHERVQCDEFYNDDGSYLDSGYEIGSEATAWMPLPEQYREEEDMKTNK